ncbi:thiamine pyrophosphate-binding protein [Rhodobacterales bacterium HKCCE3408]|nr:thiamine pyrophosphate-binding protein [Rhodobacterales bacterium HKCCE3408]
MATRHGGKILADQLAIQGVERVFSVPGESFLAALDGLYDSGIQNVVCRQEGGAAMMAEAHGKVTGKPGVLFVTRGPGATNASSGIHVAMHDSTPIVVFVGQVPLAHRDRSAFQEVDYRAFFGPLAKWSAEVERTDRLPEYIARAFQIAQSGRPGPVVLALPEDVLSAEADVPDLKPAVPVAQPVDAHTARQALDRLMAHRNPLIVAGGTGWSREAQADLEHLAEATGLPVAVTFRRQHYMDNLHPNYVGDLGVGANPALQQRFSEADALLVLGTRLGDTATKGYALLDPGKPAKTIIHVHPDPDELGRVHQPDMAVAARAPDMLAVMARLNDLPHRDMGDTAAGHAALQAWRRPQETPGSVKLERVVRWLSDHLDGRGIVTNGAGNYAAFVHRYHAFRRYGGQVGATSGSMGYGLPAAIAAKLANPDQTVVCYAGDGCMQMTLNELSTARQYGADIIVIVANNGRYGTIRAHQEREYPGRVSGTDLFNPDYAALARAYGGTGHTVTDTDQFPEAFAEAEKGGLHIIELMLDRDMLTTTYALSDLPKRG